LVYVIAAEFVTYVKPPAKPDAWLQRWMTPVKAMSRLAAVLSIVSACQAAVPGPARLLTLLIPWIRSASVPSSPMAAAKTPPGAIYKSDASAMCWAFGCASSGSSVQAEAS